MKKITLIPIIIFICLLFFYFGFLKREKTELKLVTVSRGNILQEVSESGQIQRGESFNLSFKNSGRIQKINVKVGDKIRAGDVLAELDKIQLISQLSEAEANLELAKIKLNKLLAGATTEEINIAKAAVENAQISLKVAKQNLEDIKLSSQSSLKSAYESAITILDDSLIKIFNAFTTVEVLQKNYFQGNDQASISVKEAKEVIFDAHNKAKSCLDYAKKNFYYEDIDQCLSQTKKLLDNVSNSLRIVREACQEGNYQEKISSTEKTNLDNQRTSIATALINLTNAQQNISSIKTTNILNVNSAQGKVELAEGQLKASQEELNKLISPPRQEDVDLANSQLKQAQAQVQLLENQIADCQLKSPVDGQVVKIEKRVGETVQPAFDKAVIVILPAVSFEIKVDIYEEDVVKINSGDPVDISLVAFPEKIFKGKVRSINPAEKIINGVVYYEVIIDFEEMPENLKSGMTADVVIKTAFKENVLLLPSDAIQKKDGKNIVEVLKNGKIEEREIKIGLKGSQGMTEIVSGLSEGEKVILR